jgi:acetyltransferase-like isoleucine patch superfamily enzyme
MNTSYELNINSRSLFRFLKGLYPRGKKFLIQNYINWIARRNGAQIGKAVVISYQLAKKANSNLIIGDHTSIQTSNIDLRIPIKIGSHVIIGSDVQIITVSHNIDSLEWEHKYYGLEIKDYVWLATRTFILPSCRKIHYGAVCAAGAVVVKDVEEMSVVSGNPAKLLRYRKNVHSNLVVESLLGNDLKAYINAYRSK